MGFTNIFGGSPVSPADVAYASYEFSANLALVWPAFANGNPNVAARFMNLVADNPLLDVIMPDATLISPGYDAIISNSGSNGIDVLNFSQDGSEIVFINPGESYYIILADNSTPDGIWQVVQFGVGTSFADASALVGAGLLALAGVLNVNLNAVDVSSSYALTSVARDVLQVWTGGSGVITLPSASSAGNGFMFPLANNGSGSVTVTPVGGDLIDGASSSVFSQTQSGFVISTGTGWVTVGKGIQNTFAVTLLNLNVAGSSDVVETSAQAQNIIQVYTGVLTGNINVIVPNTVQLYYINNSTTGAFTLTVKTAAGTGVSVAQGSHVILYCDGTNVVNAFTATITSNLTIPAGSAASPSLNVTGSLTTGLFSAAPNTISTTAGGNEVTRYASAASAVNHITETSSAAGQPVIIGSDGADAAIPITMAGKGGAPTNFPNVNITGGSISGVTTDFGTFTTGDVKPTYKAVADSGWVMADDGTIGSAASGATTRANADTLALFTLFWNNISNTYAPVSSGRGANAAADFAANKTIKLPALLSRALGAAGAGAGLSVWALGQTFGEENHALITAELASHSHPAIVTDPTHTHTAVVTDPGHHHAPTAGNFITTNGTLLNIASGSTSASNNQGVTANSTTGITVANTAAATGISVANSNTGSGTGHNTIQPTSFLNLMIKL